nr:MAG TPA: hypothetical protein [Caudoviricetes sp.]
MSCYINFFHCLPPNQLYLLNLNVNDYDNVNIHKIHYHKNLNHPQ